MPVVPRKGVFVGVDVSKNIRLGQDTQIEPLDKNYLPFARQLYNNNPIVTGDTTLNNLPV